MTEISQMDIFDCLQNEEYIFTRDHLPILHDIVEMFEGVVNNCFEEVQDFIDFK